MKLHLVTLSAVVLCCLVCASRCAGVHNITANEIEAVNFHRHFQLGGAGYGVSGPSVSTPVSWIKQFLMSDYFPKCNELKNSVSNRLIPDDGDMLDWSTYDPDDYKERDDEYSEYDSNKNDGVLLDFQPYVTHFIRYLIDNHNFEEQDLSDLNELDFGDIDNTITEIYHRKKSKERIDIQEPEFNVSIHLDTPYLSLLGCAIIFFIFI